MLRVTSDPSLSDANLCPKPPQIRSNLCIMKSGMLFTSPSMRSHIINSAYGMLVLSVRKTQPRISTSARISAQGATIVNPLTPWHIDAIDVPVLCLAVDALHPHFRLFRAIGSFGQLSLSRAAYSNFDSAIDMAYMGLLSRRALSILYEQLIDLTALLVPASNHVPYRRIGELLKLLDENPDVTLRELANRLGLSMHRLSHVFSSAIGIPLRSFLLWRKIQRFGHQYSLNSSVTDIAQVAGFHDAQHLNRTFVRSFGASPSYFLRNKRIRCMWAAPRAGLLGAKASDLRPLTPPHQKIFSETLAPNEILDCRACSRPRRRAVTR